MRIVPFFITTAITLFLLWALNRPWGSSLPMPIGSFLSPQTGFWQNAESVNKDFNDELTFPNIKGKAEVYFDERLVPHVFAENEEDLYFIQGYLHAKFRLFQMDLQTRAAEGRISEIVGAVAVNYDKEQRRLGMKLAAENSLRAMEKNPKANTIYNAYTAGVNTYIHSLQQSTLPLEYKLLNFKPEEWTNLRTALLLKMMAQMLSSGADDLNYTKLRSILSYHQISSLYPQINDSLVPMIPKGTIFPNPAVNLQYPDSVEFDYFERDYTASAVIGNNSDPDNGSNNWVVAGSKTASGYPILCNDPHLELSLPSIWYEMQLSTPASKTYGVTLPGSPYIIIGFNDSISWGVTNSQRDVMDFYTIKYKDNTRKEYWFNNAWQPTQQRVEEIKVQNNAPVYDTVSYTVFGPVLYDGNFKDSLTDGQAVAIKWTAHETGDDGFTFYKLNHANNYDEYVTAIETFECPGQNFVFASKTGDIALWQQGKFPARWNGQGLYIMPGTDSSYWWQHFIPQQENPHAFNPKKGFLESANQRPADAAYPYFIPGAYITPRAITIENTLSGMQNITVQNMMDLQSNTFNVTAKDMLPLMMEQINMAALSPEALKYFSELKDWNYMADATSRQQTIYQCWFDSLRYGIWFDEMGKTINADKIPNEQTTMEILKRDTTAFGFVDNVTTPAHENLRTIVTDAFNKATAILQQKEKEGNLTWAKFKDVSVFHLLKTVTAFAKTGLNVGGWSNTVNAVKKSHGPSWRMIVQMNTPTEAYGVYPGGQSGNPGSKFYDNAVETWVAGKYYTLWMMKYDEKTDNRVKWTLTFQNKK
ncbi:MAG: penicillin acylase family protein [Niabella sp.]